MLPTSAQVKQGVEQFTGKLPLYEPQTRMEKGLDTAIQLGVEAGPTVMAAISAHRDTVVGETLAVDLILGELDGPTRAAEIDGEPVTVSVQKAAFASPA